MKKKAALALAVMMMLAALPMCMGNVFTLSLWVAAAAMMLINFLAVIKNRRQAAPFNPKSEIRNVHTLIIGDMIDPEITGTTGDFVQIFAPGRSLQSCIEILRHTHSILDDKKDDSCVIFAVKKGNDYGFSVWDIPFFHTITIRKYGLGKLNRLRRFPALICPIIAILMTLGIKRRDYRESFALTDEALKFCRERGYKLRMFVR